MKYEGFTFLSNFAKVLNGEVQIEPDLLSALKYAPITSDDVKRSLSIYKLTLSDLFA